MAWLISTMGPPMLIRAAVGVKEEGVVVVVRRRLRVLPRLQVALGLIDLLSGDRPFRSLQDRPDRGDLRHGGESDQ